MKIIQIGAVPPPMGGVSVLIKRIHKNLQHIGIQSVVIDVSGLGKKLKKSEGILCYNWCSAFFHLICSPTIPKKTVIIFHTNHLLAFFLAVFLKLRYKVVFTVHGEGLINKIKALKNNKNLIKSICNVVCLFLIRKQKNYFCVSQDIQERLKAILSKSINTYTLEGTLFTEEINYPRNKTEIDTFRSDCDLLIFFYQYKWNYHNGQLLYGADICIDAFIKLNKSGINCKLIFLCPNHEENSDYQKVVDLLKLEKLQDKVLFLFCMYTDLKYFYQICDMCLRATNTDGPSVLMQESLFYGTPVIASNCVPRVTGAVLFSNRNVESLVSTIKKVYANLDKYKDETKKCVKNFYIQDFVDWLKVIE